MAKPAIKVYVQHHGNMMCDYRWLLVNAEWMQSKSDQQPQSKWGPCPTHTLVVDHPNARFLSATTCPRHCNHNCPKPPPLTWFPYPIAPPHHYSHPSPNP